MFKRKYGPVATLSLLSGGLNIPFDTKPLKSKKRQNIFMQLLKTLKQFLFS